MNRNSRDTEAGRDVDRGDVDYGGKTPDSLVDIERWLGSLASGGLQHTGVHTPSTLAAPPAFLARVRGRRRRIVVTRVLAGGGALAALVALVFGALSISSRAKPAAGALDRQIVVAPTQPIGVPPAPPVQEGEAGAGVRETSPPVRSEDVRTGASLGLARASRDPLATILSPPARSASIAPGGAKPRLVRWGERGGSRALRELLDDQ
ncbi:MAG: hypothetical protein SFZ23_02820 [Planctomycetota bacterium]|nr:hypothetical protein [Planctomycetota bacterium]